MQEDCEFKLSLSHLKNKVMMLRSANTGVVPWGPLSNSIPITKYYLHFKKKKKLVAEELFRWLSG